MRILITSKWRRRRCSSGAMANIFLEERQLFKKLEHDLTFILELDRPGCSVVTCLFATLCGRFIHSRSRLPVPVPRRHSPCETYITLRYFRCEIGVMQRVGVDDPVASCDLRVEWET